MKTPARFLFTALVLAAATARAGDPRAVPVNLSLLPGLSTNDFFPGPVENAFAFGVLGAHAGALRGVQLSGFFNQVEGDMTGVQFAGAGNVAHGAVRGLQLGALGNFAGDLTGVQIGLVNVASRVRGVQLGAVNVSDDPDGIALGFFNFVKGGRFDIEVFAGDQQPLNVALKTGSRHTHSVAFIGAGRDSMLVIGGGMGFHFGDSPWIEIDATFGINQILLPLLQVGVGAETDILAALRVGLGLKLSPRLSIFVRPTFNYAVSFAPTVPPRNSWFPVIRIETPELGGGGHQLWPGLQIGLQT